LRVSRRKDNGLRRRLKTEHTGGARDAHYCGRTDLRMNPFMTTLSVVTVWYQ